MSREKPSWSDWKDSVVLWAFVFVAWPASVLIAFDYALLYPIIAIVVAAILVMILRGSAFTIAALGTGMCIGAIHGLGVLHEHNGESTGALELMPARWTWQFLLLLLVFGIIVFLIGAIRLRRLRGR